MRTRLLSLLLGLLVQLAPAAHATGGRAHWVEAGPTGQQMHYFIDAETVRKEGDLVRYQLMGRGAVPTALGTTYTAEIGVDCARGLRVQFLAITRWSGGVRTTTGSERVPVAQGSREAAELARACELAGRATPHTRQLSSAGGPSVRAIRWTGTAFAINTDLLITADHVVRGCGKVEVLHRGSMHLATVVASDRASDLAALTIRSDELQPLAVASRPRELGEQVVVLGYPLAKVLGSSLRVTSGIVSALAGVQDERESIQISAPVQSGNSGGPALGDRAEVIGVVTKRLDPRLNGENVNFAIQAHLLHEFLERFRLPHQMAPPRGGTPLDIAGVVRKAAPAILLVVCS